MDGLHSQSVDEESGFRVVKLPELNGYEQAQVGLSQDPSSSVSAPLRVGRHVIMVISVPT